VITPTRRGMSPQMIEALMARMGQRRQMPEVPMQRVSEPVMPAMQQRAPMGVGMAGLGSLAELFARIQAMRGQGMGTGVLTPPPVAPFPPPVQVPAMPPQMAPQQLPMMQPAVMPPMAPMAPVMPPMMGQMGQPDMGIMGQPQLPPQAMGVPAMGMPPQAMGRAPQMTQMPPQAGMAGRTRGFV
jgi:hypothetical protein